MINLEKKKKGENSEIFGAFMRMLNRARVHCHTDRYEGQGVRVVSNGTELTMFATDGHTLIEVRHDYAPEAHAIAAQLGKFDAVIQEPAKLSRATRIQISIEEVKASQMKNLIRILGISKKNPEGLSYKITQPIDSLVREDNLKSVYPVKHSKGSLQTDVTFELGTGINCIRQVAIHSNKLREADLIRDKALRDLGRPGLSTVSEHTQLEYGGTRSIDADDASLLIELEPKPIRGSYFGKVSSHNTDFDVFRKESVTHWDTPKDEMFLPVVVSERTGTNDHRKVRVNARLFARCCEDTDYLRVIMSSNPLDALQIECSGYTCILMPQRL